MTNFNKLKEMNFEQLVDWLYTNFDEHIENPWDKWFDDNYCNKCKSVKSEVKYLKGIHDCAYCEINNKCKFFENYEETLNSKDVIKEWLLSKENPNE